MKDLRNQERVSSVVNAQQVSEDLHIIQEWERKKIEERIAECTYHIDDSKISYQSLINDIHQSEIVFKTVKDIIASAYMAIAKAQALIQDNS